MKLVSLLFRNKDLILAIWYFVRYAVLSNNSHCGEYRIRTDDPLLAGQVLYQLS